MDKMRMESEDIQQDNVAKIAALFPNCVTEARDKDGHLKKAINFDLLRQMLSGDVLEGDEAYEFTWVGKKAAIVEANKPIRKTLRPYKEESVNWDTTENLYIEGDNLEVLKLLQESYLGKVKMIYIDPPYNTGNDFVYPDSFIMDNEDYNEGIGYFDEDGNVNYGRENSEVAGKYHSDWCSMMYSRLLLARNLLTEDGVIFISIDDNELENLKKICEEIFGASNFIANIVWKHTQQSKNDELYFSRQYNHILVYAMNKTSVARFYFERTDEDNKNYSNPDNDPKGAWRSGDVRSPNYRRTLCFDIIAPNGNVIKAPTKGWRWSEESIKEKIATGEIKFKDDYSGIIRKIYLCDQPGRTPENLWEGQRFGTTRQAAAVIKDLFDGVQVFDTPKPHELIEAMLQLATDKDSVIMDFFAGSGTSAHAVMDFNSRNGGTRKYILVQVTEPCSESSEAFKAGYKNICEIGKERIRRAAKKIKEENPAAAFDGGFRVFKLDESNMNDVYYSAGEYHQDMLSLLESNVKSDRTDLDLLFGCLLEWGLPLSMPYTSEQIEGCTVHTYNEGDLIACFDKNIPDSVIKEIAKRQPLRAVFRDSSFKDSPSKINVGEIFKMLAPDTRIKVI
ncbi:site-specific DNA-methyltransferase [Veillonellaceae bacterium M2-4]|nr:site-specific DNA-methyltransferase [Veillonellaceae bacterium M2-4]